MWRVSAAHVLKYLKVCPRWGVSPNGIPMRTTFSVSSDFNIAPSPPLTSPWVSSGAVMFVSYQRATKRGAETWTTWRQSLYVSVCNLQHKLGHWVLFLCDVWLVLENDRLLNVLVQRKKTRRMDNATESLKSNLSVLVTSLALKQRELFFLLQVWGKKMPLLIHDLDL